MRPTRPQQAPTSFIRKWPKARRDNRGPSEYFEDFSIEGVADRQEAWNALQAIAQSSAKPGWAIEFRPPVLTVVDRPYDLKRVLSATIKVRFFKKK